MRKEPPTGEVRREQASGPATAERVKFAPHSMAESPGHRVAAASTVRPLDIGRVEGRLQRSSVRKVAQIVDEHPVEAVSVIRHWLHDN